MTFFYDLCSMKFVMMFASYQGSYWRWHHCDRWRDGIDDWCSPHCWRNRKLDGQRTEEWAETNSSLNTKSWNLIKYPFWFFSTDRYLAFREKLGFWWYGFYDGAFPWISGCKGSCNRVKLQHIRFFKRGWLLYVGFYLPWLKILFCSEEFLICKLCLNIFGPPVTIFFYL